ncbi:MAG: hypothetical protein V3575_01980 [Candidatus Absconditabacteria bacterium]
MGILFTILIIFFSIFGGILKTLISEYIRINLLGSYIIGIIIGVLLFVLGRTYKSVHKTIGYFLLFFASLVYLITSLVFSYYNFTNSSQFNNYSQDNISNKIVTKENLSVKNIVNKYTTKDISTSQEYRNLINRYSDVNISQISTTYPNYLLRIKSRIGDDLYFDYLTQFTLAIKIKESLDKNDTDIIKENIIKYYDYYYQNTGNNYHKYMKESVLKGKYDSNTFLSIYYGDGELFGINIIGFLKYKLKDSLNFTFFNSSYTITYPGLFILELLEFITYFLGLITIIRFSYLKKQIKTNLWHNEYLEFRTNEPLDKIGINFNIFRNVSYYSDGEKFKYIIKLFLSKENPQDPTDLSAKLMFYQNNKKLTLLLEKIIPIESGNYVSLTNKLGIEQRIPQIEDEKSSKIDEFKIPDF